MSRRATIYPNGEFTLNWKDVDKFFSGGHNSIHALECAKLKVDGMEIVIYPESVDFSGAGLKNIIDAMARELLGLRAQDAELKKQVKELTKTVNELKGIYA